MTYRAINGDTVHQPVIVIVMGVSGSGKSTVGRKLAAALGCTFCEGDDLHPRRNVEKMSRGKALTDADRRPWLQHIREWIDTRLEAGESAVVSCSALKRRYRYQLTSGRPQVRILYLRGSHRVIARRLRHRRGHFMPASLLDSQFAALEPPAANELHAVVDVGYGEPVQVVARALQRLRLNPHEDGINRDRSMNFRIPLLVAVIASTSLSGCSLFGSKNDSVARARASNAEGPARATPEAADFLVEMVDARRMDYAEGALAVTHATTPELRAYGAEMTRDQTLMLKELTTLAATLRITIPQTISDDKRGPLQTLVDEQGPDFDKRFMSMITIDHERDVKAFTAASDFNQDPLIQNFARRRVGLIQMHLDEINEIRKAY